MKNKSLCMLIVALVLSSGVANAQKVSKTDSEVEFKSHVDLQLMGGAGYTIAEGNYLQMFSPAAALNLGWQITPTFGLRLGGTGWQGKGTALSAQGIENYAFKFAQGSLDLTFDLANLFGGYRHDRGFSPYLFVGGGAAYGFDNGANNVKSVNPSEYFAYLWAKNLITPVGRGGIGANIRLTDALAIMIEANANVLNDHFNSKKANNPDFQFNCLAGLKINLGKAYTRTPAPVVVDNSAAEREAARLAAEKAAAEKAAAEKAAAEKAAAEKAAAEKAARDAAMQQICTFFERDSFVILPAEAKKLNDYVEWLKENPNVNISLTGYADVQTGRHKHNMWLSENRAAVVKDFLVNAGISESRITTDFKGDTVQPFAENDKNRVTISLVTK